MRTASFKAGTLRRVGFSAKDLKCFNVKELRGACTAVELAEEEYTAAELYPIFSARELLPAYPTIEIKQAGATLRELLRAGLTVEEALDADFTVLELKLQGVSPSAMVEAGVEVERLRSVGFSAGELRSLGFSARDLNPARCALLADEEELCRKLGYSSPQHPI
uniref:Uncharacterized protein n=1 Tax=Prymnesium polylepis TaxID=72548 RepID=A0A7S4N054_9EUKA